MTKYAVYYIRHAALSNSNGNLTLGASLHQEYLCDLFAFKLQLKFQYRFVEVISLIKANSNVMVSVLV